MKEKTECSSSKPTKVLFVATSSPLHPVLGESLGIEALAGHLNSVYKRRVATELFDFQLETNPNQLREKIVRTQPDILANSVKIGSLEQLDSIMEILSSIPKEQLEKQPQIIMGGTVPTFAPLDLLQRYPNSLMAVGEGETTMEALMRETDLSKVPNLVYRKEDGEIVQTKRAALSLSTIHLPDRTMTEIIYKKGGMVWIEGSRGCDKHCTFCSRKPIRDKKGFESFPIDSVIKDIKQLVLMDIREFSFTDDDFIGNDIDRIRTLAERIKSEKLSITFSISTRSDAVFSKNGLKGNEKKFQTFKALRESGLVRVFLGIESGSPSQLKRYVKGCDVETNFKALAILRSLGIDVVAGFIPIDPLTTIEELTENIEFCVRTGLYKKVSNPLSVLRVQEGSAYKTLSEKRGLLGKKTSDLVFYDASFENPLVQKIASISNKIINDIYPFIYGLKGEVARGTLAEDINKQTQVMEAWLHGFREREMELLQNIINDIRINNGINIDMILQKFEVSRHKDLALIQKQLEAGVIGDKSNLLAYLNQTIRNINS